MMEWTIRWREPWPPVVVQAENAPMEIGDTRKLPEVSFEELRPLSATPRPDAHRNKKP